MRILALDAALARCSVALVTTTAVTAHRTAQGGRGQSAVLAPMVEEILNAHGRDCFDAVAVTIGPGSFTGLRTALALAHGLAAGGRPVIAVTIAEALAATLDLGERTLWTVIDSRRGRIFLDIAGQVQPIAIAIAALPTPQGPIAIAGDAAIAVAATLAARGCNIRLTDARQPDAAAVAKVALQRLRGELPPLEAQPLYIDPPEAKLPAGGLRPPPLP